LVWNSFPYFIAEDRNKASWYCEFTRKKSYKEESDAKTLRRKVRLCAFAPWREILFIISSLRIFNNARIEKRSVRRLCGLTRSKRYGEESDAKIDSVPLRLGVRFFSLLHRWGSK
jgi:hypothetical protein